MTPSFQWSFLWWTAIGTRSIWPCWGVRPKACCWACYWCRRQPPSPTRVGFGQVPSCPLTLTEGLPGPFCQVPCCRDAGHGKCSLGVNPLGSWTCWPLFARVNWQTSHLGGAYPSMESQTDHGKELFRTFVHGTCELIVWFMSTYPVPMVHL